VKKKLGCSEEEKAFKSESQQQPLLLLALPCFTNFGNKTKQSLVSQLDRITLGFGKLENIYASIYFLPKAPSDER